jgi:hypothetical protein
MFSRGRSTRGRGRASRGPTRGARGATESAKAVQPGTFESWREERLLVHSIEILVRKSSAACYFAAELKNNNSCCSITLIKYIMLLQIRIQFDNIDDAGQNSRDTTEEGVLKMAAIILNAGGWVPFAPMIFAPAVRWLLKAIFFQS